MRKSKYLREIPTFEEAKELVEEAKEAGLNVLVVKRGWWIWSRWLVLSWPDQ